MVLQSSAEVPLENTRAGLYEWVEDIGAILLDMMGTYYGKRPVVREREVRTTDADAMGNPVLDPATGLMTVKKQKRRVVEMFDFSVFKDLWLRVRVDAGASTYFSEIAMVQTLDNLRRDGTLDIIEYLERIPDKLIPRKAELIEALRERSDVSGEDASNSVGISEAGALTRLPTTVQAKYSKLPAAAQRALMARAKM